MREGQIVLMPLPQADGAAKNRPVLLLREMPPFGDFLSCGISTQVHQAVPNFDEVLREMDPDFPASGLLTDSIVRLGFLALLPRKSIIGSIGEISSHRHSRLLTNLGNYLTAGLIPRRK